MTDLKTATSSAHDMPDGTPLIDAYMLAQFGKYEASMTAPCQFKALDMHTLRIMFSDTFGFGSDKITTIYECKLILPRELDGLATVTLHGEGDDEGMVKTATMRILFYNNLECTFETVWQLFNAVLSYEFSRTRERLKLSPYDK